MLGSLDRSLSAVLLLVVASCARPAAVADPVAAPPVDTRGTAPAITAADLRTRLSILAHDSMQGRMAGTGGNVRGTDYLAAEARRIGLEPAGEEGTYFQTVPLVRRTLATPGTLALVAAGTSPGAVATLRPWADYLPRDQGKGARSLDGVAVVYGGVWGDERSLIPSAEARGKLVVLRVAPGPDGAPVGTVNRAMVTARFLEAAGIAIATLDLIAPEEQAELSKGGAQLAAQGGRPLPSFLYVTTRAATELLDGPPGQVRPGVPGRTVKGDARFVDLPTEAPARNVVARLPGTDPALAGQLVALGAHNDHEGLSATPVDHDSLRAYNAVIRPEGANDEPREPTLEEARRIRTILDSLRGVRPPRRDSILNGADDDGSGSVGLLEIAEALAAGPTRPKRSVLFVWHTAEEMGLLGADWFTRHPTVPRDSIVAQINVDMIGRGGAADLHAGGPGYLVVIGSRRLSTELGDLAEQVNRRGSHGFTFDYSYDADGHPENYYCRSDHYMYARFGIPVAFFSTGAHRDYHQVTDEPQYIDYPKLARVTGFLRDLALGVANLDHRLVVDKPKPDPDAPCRQ